MSTGGALNIINLQSRQKIEIALLHEKVIMFRGFYN